MNFYFVLYPKAGLQALKIRTQDPDGYIDYIWGLTDFAPESDREWGNGQVSLKVLKKTFTCSPTHPQVNFNTHQLTIEAIHADNSSTTGFAALDGKGRHPKKIINFF